MCSALLGALHYILQCRLGRLLPTQKLTKLHLKAFRNMYNRKFAINFMLPKNSYIVWLGDLQNYLLSKNYYYHPDASQVKIIVLHFLKWQTKVFFKLHQQTPPVFSSVKFGEWFPLFQLSRMPNQKIKYLWLTLRVHYFFSLIRLAAIYKTASHLIIVQ